MRAPKKTPSPSGALWERLNLSGEIAERPQADGEVVECGSDERVAQRAQFDCALDAIHAWQIIQLERAIELRTDRKSTRLNSSHPSSSYAVFCLKKKMQTKVVM